MILPMIMAGASIASSVGGMFGANKAAKKAAEQNRLQSLIQGTAFSPIGVNMPGGGGISFGGGGGGGGGTSQIGGGGNFLDPRTGKPLVREQDGMRILGSGKNGRAFQSDIGNIGLNLGDLEPFRAGLAGFGGQGAQQLGALQGLGLEQGGLAQMLSSQQGLDSLTGLAGGQLGGAVNDFSQFRDNLQSPLLQGLQSAIGDASLTGQQAADQHLALLREQAQPFEDRAFSTHQDNQFMTGQRGTSGGALQTEAFARGLGQADLSRQLAARGEGRAATQMALNQASGLGGLQESLLNGATNRFGNLAQLSQGLSAARFNQGQQFMGLPQSFDAGQLNNLNASLSGLTNLTNISTVPANLALQFMTNQANTRIGQAGAMSPGTQAMPAAQNASMLSGLGSALSQGNNLQTLSQGIGGLFNRGGGGSNFDPNGMVPFTPS